MRKGLVVAVFGSAVLVGCTSDVVTNADDGVESSNAAFSEHANVPVCPGPAAPGSARCHARQVTDAAGEPLATTAPSGYAPADLWKAYNLPSLSSGVGRTIAIVDAYDATSAESDLAVYRAQFGLPPCTTANGCFRKVNQDGTTTSYPRADSGWALEIALDLDMASAICPNCNILLVEASSASMTDLGTAVDTAVRLGANVVSNSYGGGEFSTEADVAAAHYAHAGVVITASSGDSGYGVEFPAAAPQVVAVGGTTLNRASTTRGFAESAWSGSGSGCSAYIPKPSWQTDTGCAKRSVADVAAVADPATGVAVYSTSGRKRTRGGWTVVGGTSAASPIVAAVYALAGNAPNTGYTYSHASGLFDVTSGSNGSCGTYLCTARAGYDGPTGLGTPNGTSAF